MQLSSLFLPRLGTWLASLNDPRHPWLKIGRLQGDPQGRHLFGIWIIQKRQRWVTEFKYIKLICHKMKRKSNLKFCSPIWEGESQCLIAAELCRATLKIVHPAELCRTGQLDETIVELMHSRSRALSCWACHSRALSYWALLPQQSSVVLGGLTKQ